MPKAQKLVSTPKPSSGQLVVTAQQSRFHTDAFDAPDSKEIDVKDLSIAIGDREILERTELRIKHGLHYVLVGRNGTGKSTVLKALAEGQIPGIPSNLRMLLLGQTTMITNSVIDDVCGDDASQTVLEHVVRSNVKRMRALREAEKLSSALEDVNNPTHSIKIIRQLKCERLERTLSEMRLIAARRSGARGLKARKAVIALEAEVEASKTLSEQQESEIDPSDVHNEMRAAVDMLEETRSSLEAMDAAGTEAKARTVLLGLGFPEPTLETPFTSLSGGWRTRCDLACCLVQQTDVLMLDEPTNFLDLPAVIWLQNHITQMNATSLIVVTHDRDFADAVAEELIVLRQSKLERFPGNLSAYEHEKRLQVRRFTRMKEAQDRKTRHMEETIEQNIRASKRTGDDKKLRQAASRRKKIEERTGLEVNSRGGRFKINRDYAGFHNSRRDEITIPDMDPPVRIVLPASPPALRFPGPILSFEKVAYAFPGKATSVLLDVSFVIHPGERIGIAGLNGSGKSTVVKLAVSGVSSASGSMRPLRGTVTCHPRARIQCFSQHAVEELGELGRQEPRLTALSHLCTVADGEMDDQDARKLLGGLGLRGSSVSDVPLGLLSGGQKVRLALALAMWTSPHLLVLDEVTTHLDSDTILALIEALENWEGALLVVTHDRFFMRCVVEGQSLSFGDDNNDEDEDGDERGGEMGRKRNPGVVYRLRNGELRRLEGGMARYEELAKKAVAKLLAL